MCNILEEIVIKWYLQVESIHCLIISYNYSLSFVLLFFKNKKKTVGLCFFLLILIVLLHFPSQVKVWYVFFHFIWYMFLIGPPLKFENVAKKHKKIHTRAFSTALQELNDWHLVGSGRSVFIKRFDAVNCCWCLKLITVRTAENSLEK